MNEVKARMTKFIGLEKGTHESYGPLNHGLQTFLDFGVLVYCTLLNVELKFPRTKDKAEQKQTSSENHGGNQVFVENKKKRFSSDFK